MTNLKILLKNNINIVLGRLQGKKNRKSTMTAVLLLIVGAIAVLALYSLQSYGMFMGLPGALCIFHAILTTLSVCLILGIMRSAANSKNTDDDLLLSMPIKKRDIIISKTIGKYLFDFCLVFILFVPFIVIYQFMVEFSLSILLFGILLTFLFPLLSVAISYIFDFLITRLFNRIKYGTLLKSLVLVVSFILIMAFMLTKTSFYGTVTGETIESFFANRPISKMMLDLMLSPSFVNIILTLALFICPFVISMFLYSLNFGKSFAKYSNTSSVLKFEENKPFKMFYKKELKNYFSTIAYVINTIIGPIMIIVLGVAVSIFGISSIEGLLGISLDKEMFCGILALAMCFLSSTTMITACSISLEGKNIWLLKSTPISEKQLFMAKILTHLTIVEPAIIVSSVIMLICLKLSFLQFLMVILLPTLFTILISCSGLLINLWQPLLEWENETKAVKQSLSVLLTMILGALLAILPVGIYLLFNNISIFSLSVVQVFISSSVIYALLIFVFFTLLFTKGVKLFRKL